MQSLMMELWNTGQIRRHRWEADRVRHGLLKLYEPRLRERDAKMKEDVLDLIDEAAWEDFRLGIEYEERGEEHRCRHNDGSETRTDHCVVERVVRGLPSQN